MPRRDVTTPSIVPQTFTEQNAAANRPAPPFLSSNIPPHTFLYTAHTSMHIFNFQSGSTPLMSDEALVGTQFIGAGDCSKLSFPRRAQLEAAHRQESLNYVQRPVHNCILNCTIHVHSSRADAQFPVPLFFLPFLYCRRLQNFTQYSLLGADMQSNSLTISIIRDEIHSTIHLHS